MQTYRIETIIPKNRILTIRGLPFRKGEKVEVIILSRPHGPETSKGYALRGKPFRCSAPFDPVAEADWNILH
jgi:hypothetical protein